MFSRFHDGHGALLRVDTEVRVHRCPWRKGLLFAYAVAPRRGMPHSAFDELAGMRASDVPEDEPHGASDRRVGAGAVRTEDPLSRVESELTHDIAGNDRENRGRARRLSGGDR